MNAPTTYYKVLHTDGTCCHGGRGRWHLPQRGKPGKWMPRIAGPLRFCRTGYHILRREDLVTWLGPAIFTVEFKGEPQWTANKGIVSQARLVKRLLRWNPQTSRLFLWDCTKHYNDCGFAERWAAVRDAEKRWRTNRLFDYLDGKVDIEAGNL